jgi:hypothetical protein
MTGPDHRPPSGESAGSSSSPVDHLAYLADLVNDETPVDWDSERARSPDLRPQIGGLALLDRIAALHRAPFPDDDGDALPGARFRWGHLHVIAPLGCGAFGEVYRAFDPRLEREVALKLLREDAGGGNLDLHRFLEEARRMARVRHDGVVTIHGADVHDGRPGFWSDLIAGETLDARLQRDGVLGAEEARSVGLELCRALAAVHDAGIVHGDVKAANVMRDDRGRILLMDFGAGADTVDPGVPSGSGPPAARGTPLALAPELLTGASPSPASDIYALGILLYRLLTDRYPVEASTWEALETAHATGRGVPLRDRRPDLPTGLVQAIEGALDPDPSTRIASVGELERMLRIGSDGPNLLATSIPAGRGHRATAVAALVAGAAAVAVLLAVAPGSRTPEAPEAPAGTSPSLGGITAAGDIETTWYRSRQGERDAIPAGGQVRPGDGLCLEVRLPEARHLYVLNEDEEGRLYQLFPLDDLDLRNPLPAGEWHRLPGPRAGTPHDWEVTSGSGRELFLVVASREPLTGLDGLLAGLAPARVDHPLEAGADRPAPPPWDGYRGVGGLRPRTATGEVGSAQLAELARQLAIASPDPAAIWIRQRVLMNRGF